MMKHIEEIKTKTEELFLFNDLSKHAQKSSDEISSELLSFTDKIERIPNSAFLTEYLEKWIQEDKVRLNDLDNLNIDKKIIWYYERMIYVLELKLNTLKSSGMLMQN